jgi:hypothetical protein
MPALTRRRDPNAHQQTWLICYGDVHAGTIMRCVGNPNAAPQWQWGCGFYPGSRPGECTTGTAASFEAARSAFLAAWLSNRRKPIFKRGEISAIGPRRNIVTGMRPPPRDRAIDLRYSLA